MPSFLLFRRGGVNDEFKVIQKKNGEKRFLQGGARKSFSLKKHLSVPYSPCPLTTNQIMSGHYSFTLPTIVAQAKAQAKQLPESSMCLSLPKKQLFLNVVQNGGSEAASIKQYTLEDLMELKGIPVCEEINTSKCSGPCLSHCYEKADFKTELQQQRDQCKANEKKLRHQYESEIEELKQHAKNIETRREETVKYLISCTKSAAMTSPQPSTLET